MVKTLVKHIFETITDYYSFINFNLTGLNNTFNVFDFAEVDFGEIKKEMDPFIHDFFEIALIESPEVSVNTSIYQEDFSGKKYGIVVSSPSDIISWEVNDKLVGKCLNFSPEFIKDVIEKGDFYKIYSFFSPHNPSTFVIEKEEYLKIYNFFSFLTSLMQENKGANLVQVRHLLFALLDEINMLAKEEKMIMKEDNNLLSSFLLYIQTTDPKELAIQAFINQHSVSDSYFRKYIKKNAGHSPAYWIKKRKMETAARFLLKSDYSVKEISFLVGFHDPSHFCRQFKNYFNLTPGAYRNIQSINQ